jgi:hypothetical protein
MDEIRSQIMDINLIRYEIITIKFCTKAIQYIKPLKIDNEVMKLLNGGKTS